jgi:hypothetical protein
MQPAQCEAWVELSSDDRLRAPRGLERSASLAQHPNDGA